MRRRKFPTISLIFLASILFAGCLVAKPADIETESPDVTLSGTLIQAGSKFSLTVPGKPLLELDSRQVDLSAYNGKNVTVTGQYSGTTLFVSRVTQ